MCGVSVLKYSLVRFGCGLREPLRQLHINKVNLLCPEGIQGLLNSMTTHHSDFPVLDTYQAVVSAFSEFLTVAIHTILYERNIYPQTSFISARKYNYPVKQSRHPKVCKWIQDAVAAVEVEMLKVGLLVYLLCFSAFRTATQHAFVRNTSPSLSRVSLSNLELSLTLFRESKWRHELPSLPFYVVVFLQPTLETLYLFNSRGYLL